MDRNLTLYPPDCAPTPVTLADYIYPAIQKQYVTILTTEADLLADDGAEALHQMRLSLRRLRSQIRACAPMLDIPKVMGDKQIGKIARVLGKVRDLDVLQENFKTYCADLPDSEQMHLKKVASTLVKRRRKDILKVKLMLEERNYQSFKLEMKNWLNYPQYLPTAKIKVESILPDLLLSVLGRTFLHPGWCIDLETGEKAELGSTVSKLIHGHGELLHGFRKQVKANRYIMEMFTDRYPPRYCDYLDDFKQIHKIFGNIQDNLVLDKFVCKVLGKRLLVKLKTFSDCIAQNNYQNWQKWQPIQERYRKLETKQEIQLLLIGKPAA